MNDVDLTKWVQDAAGWLGLSLPPAAAGFIGAMFSLRWLARMNVVGVWVTLLMGAVAAGYLAPPISRLVGAPEGAAGLVIGLVAMGALGGLMELASQWRSDPLGFVEKIFSRGGKQ